MVQKLTVGPGKILLGLTGGFGSGKTTVAHFFEELGAYTIDTDKIVHEVFKKGNELFDKIRKLFPECLSGDKQSLDRKKIAGIVFQDANRRKALEAIIHPYVFRRTVEEISEAEEKVIVLEVPLLFETGWDIYCDKKIVVNTPEKTSEKRLQEKGLRAEEIRQRIQAQMPLEEKLKRADFVINNSSSLEETRREVEKVWRGLHPVLKGE